MNDGHIKVVIVGVKAGGAGLNLQRASNTIIFMDKEYAPAQIEQALGRVFRTGQKQKQVNINHLQLEKSNDVKMAGILTTKSTAIENLTYADYPEAMRNDLINDHLANIVGDWNKHGDEEWSPELVQAALKKAGLSTADTIPFSEYEAFQGEFDRKAYGENLLHKRGLRTGGYNQKNALALNDAKLAEGHIDKATHEKNKVKIGKAIKKWIWDVKSTALHEENNSSRDAKHTANNKLLKSKNQSNHTPRTSSEKNQCVEYLRDRKIYVRGDFKPPYDCCFRVTIGPKETMEKFSSSFSDWYFKIFKPCPDESKSI